MYGIFSRHIAADVFGIAVIAVLAAGCDGDAASTGIRQQKDDVSGVESKMSLVEREPPDWFRGERPVLRIRQDAARGRLWALTAQGVEVYDIARRWKLAEIALPGWLWAREPYVCPPDLAIGPGGEAVISSNVVPTLWHIDPVTLAISQHDLVLDEDSGKDIGFTGLAYSAQQVAFFAVSALHGSLWRIDPLLRRAQNIPLSAPLPKACSLAIQHRAPGQRASRFVGLCVRTDQGGRVVNLAPDQRSGYVRSGFCGS